MRVPKPLRRTVTAALAGLLVACTGGGGETTPVAPAVSSDTVVVASFNFPESVLLAEIYAQALVAAGIPTRRELELGPRELVLPALEQGRVDVAPEYLGTLLKAVDRGSTVDLRNAAAVRAALTTALAPRGLSVLTPAAAQDQNGFAMLAATARRLGVRTLTELARVQRSVTVGGPFECRTRAYCVPGLERVYGFDVTRFTTYGDEAQRVAALEQGLVDLAVVFTTDGRLASGDIVLLTDDRRLQPVENVVPVVSQRAREQHGETLVRALDAVSGQLTTRGLVFLNWRLSVARKTPADEARAWLRRHGIVSEADDHDGPAR